MAKASLFERILRAKHAVNAKPLTKTNAGRSEAIDDMYTRLMDEYNWDADAIPSEGKFHDGFLLTKEKDGSLYLREPLGQFDMRYFGDGVDAEYNRVWKQVQDKDGMRRAARGRNPEFEETIDKWSATYPQEW